MLKKMINRNVIFLIGCLFAFNIFSFDLKEGDQCLYYFQAPRFYDAELKIEVSKRDKEKKTTELFVSQRNGAITNTKKVALDEKITFNNVFKMFMKITEEQAKEGFELISKKITNDYKFEYKGKSYVGQMIKADIKMGKKTYKVSYIFSPELPLLGLFRFTITQLVESKRTYSFKNVMLIKECLIGGKLIKL